MRILFAGTPAFAASALEALLRAGHEVVAVLTQPDRPANRGQRPSVSAVKSLALERHLPVLQPASLKPANVVANLEPLRPDVTVVAAYGMIVPRQVLNIPSLGSINIHASLLPRWRGAAPIERAILAGDRETGISIMKMDEGLDTGPVLMQRTITVEDGDTAGSVHDKLASLGAQMIVESLPLYAQGELKTSPQPEAGVTYAKKIDKTEAKVAWEKTAMEVSRQIRAFNPAPGAFALLHGEPLKLWMAKAREEPTGAAGSVLAVTPEAVIVACGAGSVALSEMQRPGGRRQSAGEFARGFRIAPGMCFG